MRESAREKELKCIDIETIHATPSTAPVCTREGNVRASQARRTHDGEQSTYITGKENADNTMVAYWTQ